ncbi:daptide-type RiPP biosynthesis dehydogenase [Amycolatopsis sp. cmx-11-12]|uniref:daptide-type RiPP biosynthesis dehydogenase n=1 Tax=Amycolatopsis sp. cmx-11-12 TaxID=2785795 RepID=UPI003917E7EB
MMLRRVSSTPVQAGAGAWQEARRACGQKSLVITDSAVAIDQPAIQIDAHEADWRTVQGLARHIAEKAPSTVIGIGGGSVLDVVKLACLVHADPRNVDLLQGWGQRAGAIIVPGVRNTLVRRVFVSTTVGTGVEVSPVACVRMDGRKRLVVGAALRPDLAVLDPELTASLPEYLLLEGVFEALLRIIGAVAGSAHVGGLPDAEAAMLAKHLLDTGNRIAAGDTGSDVRLTAAMLSAATHTGWTLTGRAPYAPKHWYLANELSTTLGLRKMVATACVLPGVWTRIVRGDTRYGNVAQLVEAWTWLNESEPVTGLGELLQRWRIEHSVTASSASVAEAAERAVASWGGRLPMLAGLTTPEIHKLYTESVMVRTTTPAMNMAAASKKHIT